MNQKPHFEWADQSYGKLAKSIDGIIKYNKGIYKSLNQKTFLQNFILEEIKEKFMDSEEAANKYGIEFAEGHAAVDYWGYALFGKGTSKSRRLVGWVVVFDAYGVVAKYRLRSTNGAVDPAKTENEFIRNDDEAQEEIQALKRQMDEAEKKKQQLQAKKEKSKHFGQIKKRYEIEVTVKNTIYIDTQWGGKMIYILEDKEGHIFKWSTTNFDYNVGDYIRMKATVKDHTEYKGWKQTEITRPKELEYRAAE